MIAIDTNILVYAHRADSPWHSKAEAVVVAAAEGNGVWAIPWPSVHEFLAIVTHPKLYQPPTPLPVALDAVADWMGSPSLRMIGEAPGYWKLLRPALEAGKILGPKIHDGRIAAICLQHGVRELWSADRDFSHFPALKVRNPLVG